MLSLFSFFLGLILGSIANTLSLRLKPESHQKILQKFSCPHCSKTLLWWHSIPLVSFLILKAKCFFCKKTIPFSYPLVEFLFGVLFFLTAFYTPEGEYFLLFFYFFLVFCLGILTLTDVRYMDISDKISLSTLFGIVLFLVTNDFVIQSDFFPKFFDGFLGMIFIAVFFFSLFFLSKGKWMGGGDIRLGAIMGLSLGWQMGVFALFLSYILGTLFALPLLALKKKSEVSEVPFGPFLALSIFLCLLWGEEMLEWYLGLLGL